MLVTACQPKKNLTCVQESNYLKKQKVLLFCFSVLLSQCGDIETNHRLRFSSLTFCHWNLNGFTAHDSIKISLFQAISHRTIMT